MYNLYLRTKYDWLKLWLIIVVISVLIYLFLSIESKQFDVEDIKLYIKSLDDQNLTMKNSSRCAINISDYIEHVE